MVGRGDASGMSCSAMPDLDASSYHERRMFDLSVDTMRGFWIRIGVSLVLGKGEKRWRGKKGKESNKV